MKSSNLFNFFTRNIPRLALMASVALFAGTMVSCGDDDDDDDDLSSTQVDKSYVDELNKNFPGATKVSWEWKNPYLVADFRLDNTEKEAWFSLGPTLVMTRTELGKNASLLPAEVVEAINGSNYSSWVIDDMDYYERTDDSFYVIEMENAGQPDTDLYILPTGQITRTTTTDIPVTPTTSLY